MVLLAEIIRVQFEENSMFQGSQHLLVKEHFPYHYLWTPHTANRALEELHKNPDLLKDEDFRYQAINFSDPYNKTLLHMAAERGFTNVVQALMHFGATRINAKDNSGQTSLHLAAEKGHADIVHALVTRGADRYLEDNDSHTPLYLAAKQGHREIVEQFISRGFFDSVEMMEANIRDRHRALMAAAEDGHETIVDRLLKIGATTEPEKKYMTSALEKAAKNNHTSIAFKLVEHKHHNPEHHTYALMYAAKNNNATLVRKLLAHGHHININVDAQTIREHSVDYAVENKNLAVTHLLLRNDGMPRMPAIHQLNFLASCDPHNTDVLICLIILCHQYQKMINKLSAAGVKSFELVQYLEIQQHRKKYWLQYLARITFQKNWQIRIIVYIIRCVVIKNPC